MNYHNFASRIAVPRPARIKQAEPSKKEPGKATRRTTIRRPLAIAATVLVFLCLHAGAEASPEIAGHNPPPRFGADPATLIITLTGVGVTLLRLPTLWRRDFRC